jgi:DNA-binding transcriptional LysR family regulator
MEDKDWIILSVLKLERNMTKALDRLFISQPALTYRIQQLEAYFKSKLFVRNRTGIQLTPQGEVVTQYAEEMLKRLQEIHDTIQSMETEVKGTIKLGVSSTVGRYMLPEMLRNYLARYPDVDINIVTRFQL